MSQNQTIIHKFIPGKKMAELKLGREGKVFATLIVDGSNKMSARLPDGKVFAAEALRAAHLIPGVDDAQLRLAIRFARTVMVD